MFICVQIILWLGGYVVVYSRFIAFEDLIEKVIHLFISEKP